MTNSPYPKNQISKAGGSDINLIEATVTSLIEIFLRIPTSQ